MFHTRLKRSVAAVAMTVAASAVMLGATSTPALAYNFPFPDCGRSNYYDIPSLTEARYDHRDGNKLWYTIWWGPSQPVPGNPLHPNNWAHCYV